MSTRDSRLVRDAFTEAKLKAKNKEIETLKELVQWAYDWAHCDCGHPSHKADKWTKQANEALGRDLPTIEEMSGFIKDWSGGDEDGDSC